MKKETHIVSIDSKDLKSGEKELIRAAELIKCGGLVVFPTETVYGLGADAKNSQAIKSIFEAKGRPQDNPLIVHIANTSQLQDIAMDIDNNVEELIQNFWPGPLTILFKKRDNLPSQTTGGLDTVAVRMPNNEIALDLIEKSQSPIAAPSANTSGKPSPTRVEHVIEDLDGKVDMIIDGGPTGVGLESTVIDVSGERPLILRPGSVTREDLVKYLPNIEYDLSIDDMSKRPKSPGQKYRHYSPSADMEIYSGDEKDMVEAIARKIDQYQSLGKKVGILTVEEHLDKYSCKDKVSVGSIDHLDQVARNLFSSIREIDSKGVDIILAEGFEEAGIGKAIMNRMIKAAGGKIYFVK